MPSKQAELSKTTRFVQFDTTELIQRGMLAHRQGQFADAAKAYEKVLKRKPQELAALNLLADAQLNLGKSMRALETASRAIALKAEMPGTWMVKGTAERKLGKFANAITSLETALELKPDYTDALMTLAGTLRDAGHLDASIDAYEDLVELAPEMAMAHYNLGNTLVADGQFDEAIFAFENAIIHDPSYVPSYINLTGALHACDRAEDAVVTAQRALDIDPTSHRAMINRGNALKTLGRYDEAEEQYRDLIKENETDANSHDLLGTVLQGQSRLEEAIFEYRTAMKLDPHTSLYKGDLSIGLLANGELEEAWDNYNARFGRNDALVRPRKIGEKAWNGETLTGKTLFVWREQGVGDDIRFASCFNDVIAQANAEGGRVIIETDPRLVTLYARSFPAAEIRSKGDIATDGEIHYDIAAGSLPGIFRRKIGHFPKTGGYLKPKQTQVEELRAQLNALGQGLKVGIAWKSRNMTMVRRQSYTELEDWAELFGDPNIHLVNLQYDNADAEIEDVNTRLNANIHRVGGLDIMNDLDSAAALTSAVDVVVSAPTSVADMTGALGRPCFTYGPIHHPMCLGTDSLPWYPESTWIGNEWNIPILQSVDKIIGEIKKLTSRRNKVDD